MASEVGEEYVVTELTHDHKPGLPEEKERIEKAGGRVFAMEYDDGYDGPARVWLKDQDIPGLAMSRSLCDTVAHSVGVVSTPEMIERTLTEEDRVIVLGSDGLWEFIPSEEVIALIEDCETPEDAVDRLCTIAWKRWFDERLRLWDSGKTPEIDFYPMEEKWARATGGYSSAPQGDPVETAASVIATLASMGY